MIQNFYSNIETETINLLEFALILENVFSINNNLLMNFYTPDSGGKTLGL